MTTEWPKHGTATIIRSRDALRRIAADPQCSAELREHITVVLDAIHDLARYIIELTGPRRLDRVLIGKIVDSLLGTVE